MTSSYAAMYERSMADPDGFWTEWTANHALFPCGVDILFTSGDQLCGLPRSIAVEACASWKLWPSIDDDVAKD